MARKQTRYEQIADDLRKRIESGEWAAGVALPAEGKLQAEYKASRNTVRDAIKFLQQQHLLEPKPGQGTFVTPEIVPFVTVLSAHPKTGRGRGGEEGATYPAEVGEQGRQAGARAPKVQVIKCPPQIAARLKIQESKRVVSRYQERLIDDTLWSLQTSYYPLEWVQKGAEGLLDPEDISEGTVNYLAETIGYRQIGCKDLISARLANAEEQELFGLTHNHTVIEVYRTAFAEDKDSTPIRVTVTVYPSDRNQIVYEIGTVPDTREEAVQL